MLTRKELEANFHLPLEQAAQNCGLGTTRFKKACRSLGIRRWPHRLLKSIMTMEEDVRLEIETEDGGNEHLQVTSYSITVPFQL